MRITPERRPPFKAAPGLVIRIEAIHPSLNLWRSWKKRDYMFAAKSWKYRVLASLPRGAVPFTVPVDVVVEYHFAANTRHDPDNYTPKFVMDGLVGHVLEDDDFDHVRSLLTRRGADSRQPYMLLYVTPCADGDST